MAQRAPWGGCRLRGTAAGKALVEEEQEHRADDGSDDAAEVEGVLVADVEELREDQESHERPGQT